MKVWRKKIHSWRNNYGQKGTKLETKLRTERHAVGDKLRHRKDSQLDTNLETKSPTVGDKCGYRKGAQMATNLRIQTFTGEDKRKEKYPHLEIG